MANNSNLSRRAALRQQQELEARRKRNSKMIGVGLGALALVVAVVVAIAVFQSLNKPQSAQGTPPNATEGYGITIASKGTQPSGSVPHVVLYEDYQCPACKVRESQYGKAMLQLVDEGKVTLEIRTAYFLNQANKISNPRSSERAALAAAAADAVGKYREYHEVVYQNQPANEGDGYTDQQLRVDFAAQAGITGDDLTNFQRLYDEKTYADFAEKAYKAMSDNNVQSTPAYRINDKDLEFQDPNSGSVLITPNNPASLLAAIEKTASASN